MKLLKKIGLIIAWLTILVNNSSFISQVKAEEKVSYCDTIVTTTLMVRLKQYLRGIYGETAKIDLDWMNGVQEVKEYCVFKYTVKSQIARYPELIVFVVVDQKGAIMGHEEKV